MPTSWLSSALILLLAISAATWAQDRPEPFMLRVCIADVDVPGLSYPDHEGLGQVALRKAALRQGWQVQFMPRPWRRCLVTTASGEFHAVLPVMATPENLQRLRFPLAEVQPSQALSNLRMVPIRLRGSTAAWNGQHFSGLSGPVLHVAGISSIEAYLERLMQPADGSAQKPEYLGRMLLAGRSNMAVDWESRALSWSTLEEFGGRLEVLPQPVFSRPAFVAFFPGLHDQSPQAVEQLWRDTAQLYKEALARRRSLHE